jgi:hypothetical protein
MAYTLEELKDGIENMDKHNQIEVLRILTEYGPELVTLNENANRTYVNLSALSPDVIDRLTGYLSYIEKQESILGDAETQKAEFKKLLGGKK